MKSFIFIIVLACSMGQAYSQSVAGEWKLSALKKLTLNLDNSFFLKKGAFDHKGSYRLQNQKKERSLILIFDTKTIKYRILEQTKSEMILENINTGIKTNCKLIEKFENNSVKIEANNSLEENTENNVKTQNEALKKERIENDSAYNTFQQTPHFHVNNIEMFRDGKFIINPGFGLIGYIDPFPIELETNIPPINLLLELNVYDGFGVGLNVGYRSWNVPESQYSYNLYSAALRLSYHPLIINKLDTYVGISPIIRIGQLKTFNETKSKTSYDISPVIGARFYIFNAFALTAEYSYESSSNIQIGFAIILN